MRTRPFTFLLLIAGALAGSACTMGEKKFRPTGDWAEAAPPVAPPGAAPSASAQMSSAPEATIYVAPEAPPPGEEGSPVRAPISDSASVGRDFQPVYFDFDSADLRFETRTALRNYSDWLAHHANIWVRVEGHCDADGSAEYNLNLGMARALAVKSHLVGMGVDRTRLYAISYGEERPVAASDSEAGKAMNRRVEFQAYPAPSVRAASGGVTAPSAPPEERAPEPPPAAEEMP